MPGGDFTIRDMDRLRIKFRIAPAQAKLLLALYAANGEIVSENDLLEACSTWEVYPQVLKVQIHNTRKAIGREAIQNLYMSGYRLTDAGLEKVRGALG